MTPCTCSTFLMKFRSVRYIPDDNRGPNSDFGVYYSYTRPNGFIYKS